MPSDSSPFCCSSQMTSKSLEKMQGGRDSHLTQPRPREEIQVVTVERKLWYFKEASQRWNQSSFEDISLKAEGKPEFSELPMEPNTTFIFSVPHQLLFTLFLTASLLFLKHCCHLRAFSYVNSPRMFFQYSD